jgi:hypothetical protein
MQMVSIMLLRLDERQHLLPAEPTTPGALSRFSHSPIVHGIASPESVQVAA